MDTNPNLNPAQSNAEPTEPPTTRLEAEHIMEQAAGDNARFGFQPGQPTPPPGGRGPMPPTPPMGGHGPTPPIPPIPPLPPIPNIPPPPPPFMGEQAKEQPTSQSAGQRTKAGETRFATSGLQRMPRLALENFSGNIRISGAEQDYIGVKVYHDDDIANLEDTAQVNYSESGELTIKAQPMGQINRQVRGLREAFRPVKANFFDNIGEFVDQVSKLGRGWGSADFEVTVPLQCDLNVGNASGEITVQNVSGNLSVKTISGEIEARKLSGNISLASTSGEIEAHNLNGTVYLRSISGDTEADHIDGNLVMQTSSGDVEAHYIGGKLGFKSISGELEVTDANLTGFYLSTTSGDMELHGTLHPGEYEIRTVSGETKLHVQPDFSARMAGRTVSGDFRCDLPYVRSDEQRREPAASSAEQEQEKTDKEGGHGYEYRMPGYKYEYQWDLHTGHGHGHGHSDQRRHRNRWEFLIGDPTTAEQGNTRLRVRTTSGDLKIELGSHSTYQGKASDADYQKADEADYTRPLRYPDSGDLGRMVEGDDYEPDEDERSTSTVQVKATKERTRVEILQAVERKEISVEEAMRLLRQVD